LVEKSYKQKGDRDMKSLVSICGTAAAALSIVVGLAAPAAALTWPSSITTIRNDHGGYIIDYAIRMNRLKKNNSSVKFAGRCDSACTLLLGLPNSKTCITRAANFGFHLPFGADADSNVVAARYMMNTYPAWVKSWINSRGGLTHQLKVMRYDYASRYMPVCDKANDFALKPMPLF
jgi:hypothetical protein